MDNGPHQPADSESANKIPPIVPIAGFVAVLLLGAATTFVLKSQRSASEGHVHALDASQLGAIVAAHRAAPGASETAAPKPAPPPPAASVAPSPKPRAKRGTFAPPLAAHVETVTIVAAPARTATPYEPAVADARIVATSADESELALVKPAAIVTPSPTPTATPPSRKRSWFKRAAHASPSPTPSPKPVATQPPPPAPQATAT
jgi:hypothetical protein